MNLVGKAQLYLRRNSSTILSVLAVVGFAGTVVTAVRATPKALKLLDEAVSEKGEELTVVEKIGVAGPAYIPSVLLGVSTVTCILGANVLSKRNQASIASAYALINNYHKEYRKKLIELHGKEADEEVRNAMAHEHCDYHVIDIDEPDGKVLFYDEISGETILRHERDVISAEYHFNRNYTLRGYATLNELYTFLGMPQTDYGETVGWSISSGIGWVDFEHRLIDKDGGGTPLYAIDMVFSPDTDYLEDWI